MYNQSVGSVIVWIKEETGQMLEMGRHNDMQQVAVWQLRISESLFFWFFLFIEEYVFYKLYSTNFYRLFV